MQTESNWLGRISKNSRVIAFSIRPHICSLFEFNGISRNFCRMVEKKKKKEINYHKHLPTFPLNLHVFFFTGIVFLFLSLWRLEMWDKNLFYFGRLDTNFFLFIMSVSFLTIFIFLFFVGFNEAQQHAKKDNLTALCFPHTYIRNYTQCLDLCIPI